MESKVTAGDAANAPSAQTHNHKVDIINHWTKVGRWRAPPPPKNIPRPHDRAKVRNSTGGNLRRGEVVEFTDFEFTQIKPDALWFTGDTPDLTNVGWGVTLNPIVDGEIGECLVLGICIAYVKIENEDHEYAAREDGETVLKSQAAVGPVKILYKPTGGTPPEERECVVQLMDEGGSTDVIHFELTDDLFLDTEQPNNFARASKLEFIEGDNAWQNSTECVVYDHYRDDASSGARTNRGMWNGYPGYRGMAIKRPTNYTAEGWNAKHTISVASWFDDPGTFTLDVNGGTTGTISWDGSDVSALANGIESAILTEIGGTTGDVTVRVERDYGNAMLFYVEFTGDFELMPVSLDVSGASHPSMVNPAAETLNPGSSSPVDLPAYDIIWMERPAQWISFTTDEYYGETTAGQIAATIEALDDQGVVPFIGSSVVYLHGDSESLPSDRWEDVHKFAKGYATYDNHTRRYVIQNCQRVAILAQAILDEDSCPLPGVGADTYVTDFTINPTGDFVGEPDSVPDPMGVLNPMGIPGAAGDYVMLRRRYNNASGVEALLWEVVNIQPHYMTMVTDISISGGELFFTYKDVYVYSCDQSTDPQVIAETTECGEE